MFLHTARLDKTLIASRQIDDEGSKGSQLYVQLTFHFSTSRS